MNIKQKNMKYLMCLGHFCADFAQGTLAAVLPFLIVAHNYNYAVAASLVMASNIMGSVIQPLFGHIADKIDRPHLMTLGVLCTGVGMSMVGFLESYFLLCIAVVISGSGVAMFHPQGARMVNRTAVPGKLGSSIGIFSFGGNAGFILGPLVASFSVTTFGLKGTLVFGIPSMVFIILMAIVFRGYEPEARTETAKVSGDKSKETEGERLTDSWKDYFILTGLVVTRSIVYACIGTFLILFFRDVHGMDETHASMFLSLFYCASAFSALFGGKLADRFGYKRNLSFSTIVMLAGSMGFAFFDNLFLSVLMLMTIGVGVSIGYSSMVTLGQKYLPNHIGLASGLTLGLSVSTGGILAPFLGRLGDIYGLGIVFTINAFVAIIPVIISFMLPDRK